MSGMKENKKVKFSIKPHKFQFFERFIGTVTVDFKQASTCRDKGVCSNDFVFIKKIELVFAKSKTSDNEKRILGNHASYILTNKYKQPK
jgi:hypothetical protein